MHCTKDQVSGEVKRVLDFVDYVYTKFGFTYELKLSTRPDKYLGDLETWDKAEESLEEELKEFGKPFLPNKGDGAFYGPKIDITVSDAMKRKFQCATLQLDFQLPERFQLEYKTKDEGKMERPVMIHSAVLGSVEHHDYADKVREAQVAQYNCILVVGDEEVATGQVTVRLRDEDRSKLPVMSLETLLDEFKLKTANFL